jgi:hypothetical protein
LPYLYFLFQGKMIFVMPHSWFRNVDHPKFTKKKLFYVICSKFIQVHKY